MIKINSCEIQNFENILSMFNASSQFLIENPWFEYKSYTKPKPDLKNYMGIIKSNYLNSPKILLKDERNNKYSITYYIKYTNESEVNQYWISIPKNKDEKCKINQTKTVHTFWITPFEFDIENLTEETLNLLIMDRQLSIGLDIIIACVLLNINPSEFDNDENLIKAILEKLNDTEIVDEFIKDYINYFKDCFTIVNEKYYLTTIIHNQLKDNTFKCDHESNLLGFIKASLIERIPIIKQAFYLNIHNDKLIMNNSINIKTDHKLKFDVTQIGELKNDKPSYRNINNKDLSNLFNRNRVINRKGFISLKPSFPIVFNNKSKFKYYPISWDVFSFYLYKVKTNTMMDDLKVFQENYK